MVKILRKTSHIKGKMLSLVTFILNFASVVLIWQEEEHFTSFFATLTTQRLHSEGVKTFLVIKY